MCGDLTKLRSHINSLEIGLKHPNLCAVCGTNAYSKCTLCNKYVHYNVTRGVEKGKNCFFELHDDSYFGMARDDFQITNTKKGDWTKPSAQKMKKNKEPHISFNIHKMPTGLGSWVYGRYLEGV